MLTTVLILAIIFFPFRLAIDGVDELKKKNDAMTGFVGAIMMFLYLWFTVGLVKTIFIVNGSDLKLW